MDDQQIMAQQGHTQIDETTVTFVIQQGRIMFFLQLYAPRLDALLWKSIHRYLVLSEFH